MGIRNFLGWVVALAVFASAPAGAALKIDITQGNVEPLPIAVLDFVSEDGVGMKLAQVVTADLERSGLFRPIERAAFIETQVDVNVRPRFRDWRLVNALALVTGRAIRQNDGRLRVEFRLWDVVAQQQMTGLQFFTTPENWRRISHLVADAIYERLTGETGYFDTRTCTTKSSALRAPDGGFQHRRIWVRKASISLRVNLIFSEATSSSATASVSAGVSGVLLSKARICDTSSTGFGMGGAGRATGRNCRMGLASAGAFATGSAAVSATGGFSGSGSGSGMASAGAGGGGAVSRATGGAGFAG